MEPYTSVRCTTLSQAQDGWWMCSGFPSWAIPCEMTELEWERTITGGALYALSLSLPLSHLLPLAKQTL